MLRRGKGGAVTALDLSKLAIVDGVERVEARDGSLQLRLLAASGAYGAISPPIRDWWQAYELPAVVQADIEAEVAPVGIALFAPDLGSLTTVERRVRPEDGRVTVSLYVDKQMPDGRFMVRTYGATNECPRVRLHAVRCEPVEWSATGAEPPQASGQSRVYQNKLRQIENPAPLLADHPEFVEPVIEERRYESPALIDEPGADMDVRAWRFSYNARGIIEIPNRLRADRTAVIVVHPMGIDDDQGWRTPEPAGVADFGAPQKNHLVGRHTREVIDPFLQRLRGEVALDVKHACRRTPAAPQTVSVDPSHAYWGGARRRETRARSNPE